MTGFEYRLCKISAENCIEGYVSPGCKLNVTDQYRFKRKN